MPRSATRPPLLGGLDTATFLARHWQKTPLLARDALPGLAGRLAPEELAGLACEDEATSRLVVEESGGRRLRHGPFEAAEFAALPERNWTLLVQEVDRFVPEVAAVLDQVRFVPNWRLDDVMVSYATPGGGVGPHVDRYDVFLIQAAGRRRWSVRTRPGWSRELQPDHDLEVLASHEPDHTWDLDPGDVLYLPPGFPHDGVALEPCMTWSIGFRAPAVDDLAAALLETLAGTAAAERYVDPPLSPRDDPGRIERHELERLRSMLRRRLDDDALWEIAAGRAVTAPSRHGAGGGEEEPWNAPALRERVAAGGRLVRPAIGELAFVESADGAVRLFASGASVELPADRLELARLLTGVQPLDRRSLGPWLDDDRDVAVLTDLLDRGTLEMDEPSATAEDDGDPQ